MYVLRATVSAEMALLSCSLDTCVCVIVIFIYIELYKIHENIVKKSNRLLMCVFK